MSVMYSLIAAILFFIVGSPVLYKLVQSVLGGVVTIANSQGTPTMIGLLVHSLVYGALTLVLM
jgi:hypothetical protein